MEHIEQLKQAKQYILNKLYNENKENLKHYIQQLEDNKDNEQVKQFILQTIREEDKSTEKQAKKVNQYFDYLINLLY